MGFAALTEVHGGRQPVPQMFDAERPRPAGGGGGGLRRPSDQQRHVQAGDARHPLQKLVLLLHRTVHVVVAEPPGTHGGGGMGSVRCRWAALTMEALDS